MSRRVQASSDLAAQNQQKLKTLVKIESNKSCADCKRNKHPRWASWNLGIFVCIRCSGIHRGMGTHISRVKSVDLDAWTDEQLHSMLRWGNARANKYWEAKLAPGHVPSEAKIENFIRTKYESKRWVMEGGLPDPATLDVDDGDNTRQEETAPVSAQPAAAAPAHKLQSSAIAPPAKTPAPNVDLFGDHGSSTSTPSKVPAFSSPPSAPRLEQTTSKQGKPSESLLGFDFLSGPQPGPPSRPASAGPANVNTNGPSRPDLKQSILSLYASNQRTASPASQQQGPFPDGLGAISQLSAIRPTSANLNDTFGGLNIGPTQPSGVTVPAHSSFANLISPPTQKAASTNAFNAPSQSTFAGGNFFNSRAAPPQTSQPGARSDSRLPGMGSSNEFGDFAFADSPGVAPSQQVGLGNYSPSHSGRSIVPNTIPSVFNLSKSTTIGQSKPSGSLTGGLGNELHGNSPDPWGSNDVWRTANTISTPANVQPKAAPTVATNTSAWGWGDAIGSGVSTTTPSTESSTKPSVQVAGDEEFGGWESSSNVMSSAPAPGSSSGGWESNNNVTNSAMQQPRPSNNTSIPPRTSGGFGGGGDDLFSNVWE